MAHTSAASGAATIKQEEVTNVTYYFQDEHGQIAKRRKPAQVKLDSMDNNAKGGLLFAHTGSSSNSGGSGTGAAASTVSRNGGSTTGIGNVGRVGAFTVMGTNEGQFIRLQDNYVIPKNNSKMKSKLHSIQNPPVHTMASSASTSSVQRKRKPDKAGKGLRHFSMKVCEKVQEKGKTTYNEVADDLVNEELKNNSYDTNCDQKNIRRRVYDALNVLMAINVISKDKKEIRWLGLPANSAEQFMALEAENQKCRERIQQKHELLRELIMQHVAFKELVERNKKAENQGVVPSPNSSIQLPFIIVNTHKSTKINCSVTNDKSEFKFKFDQTFEMHDDIEVLKRLGLSLGLEKGECSAENIERIKSWVPPNLAKNVEAYGTGKSLDAIYDSDDEEFIHSKMELDDEDVVEDDID